ncbi:hypothetical protein ACLMJK_009067 [Lecanora helva]
MATLEVFQVIIQGLDNLLIYTRQKDLTTQWIALLLIRAIATARYNISGIRSGSAIGYWQESFGLGMKSHDWEARDYALKASNRIFMQILDQVRSSLGSPEEKNTHVKSLQALADSACSLHFNERPLRLPLASYYSSVGRQDIAKGFLEHEMRTAISLLSDDYPENDKEGYTKIAQILTHIHDDFNALSAWSLCGPNERFNEDGGIQTQDAEESRPEHNIASPKLEATPIAQPAEPMYRSCDGLCDKELTFADSLWFCKVCNDVQFENQCLQKLRDGTLPFYVCSPNHDFLHVPSWVDEYQATGKGRVRVGGELIDGRRVGDSIVPVEQWLDTIKKDWNIG